MSILSENIQNISQLQEAHEDTQVRTGSAGNTGNSQQEMGQRKFGGRREGFGDTS